MVTTIVQIGNQTAPHATEAAFRDGYEHAGCMVVGIDQEEAKARGPEFVLDQCDVVRADLLVYSRTHNNTALGSEWTDTWRTLEARGTKTAGCHLDVFWGLSEREDWILRDADPMFTVGTLFTADGGSDDKWKAAGVNHVWLAPGADARFIPPQAEPFEELAGKVVFVGSVGYHHQWRHRGQMLDFARTQYGPRFIEFGGGTIRGTVRGGDLARIYASDCVVIGDCCFADQRRAYVSDRLPESLARGALLLMATNDGLEEYWEPDVDYVRWRAGDFDDLAEAVRWSDDAPRRDREVMRSDGQAVTLRRHTYRDRARAVLTWMRIPVEDSA